MTVKKYIALIVLIGISELVSCDVCKLDFDRKKESKWTKFQRRVVKALKTDVTYDCENFNCRHVEDQDLQVDKSNKTGCRCSKEVKDATLKAYDCRCCFKIKRWDFLLCIASAIEVFTPFKFSIFATFDGRVFARISLPLKSIADKYIPLCIPALLPPPLHWLSPCFKFKFEVPNNKNNFTWKVCGKIRIGIFLVPILTIYTKCFIITQHIDLMTMEGQTSIDEEVETPATVKVKDQMNLDACMCLSNKKKADAIASKSSRDTGGPGESIVMDVKINWQETKFEKSPFLVLLYTDNYLLPIQDLHDDDEYKGLQELVQEAEENQWMNATTPPASDYPGGSCGGALLTADKVLTLCSCVRSFYAAHKLKKNFDDEEDEFQFDITSYEIRLKFADPSLASGKYFLDTDDSKMIADSECSKNIDKSAPPEVMKTSMIVMPFTPSIENPNDIFVYWPPGVFPARTVRMVAYGMEVVNIDWVFKDSSGNVIDFPNTAVEFYLKGCGSTDYCEKELGNEKPITGPVKDRTKCICAENAGFQLFGGEIGFPLTLDRQLFGLTSLPVDNGTEGSTVGTVFDATALQEIERYVGIDNLHTATANPADKTTAPTSTPPKPNPTSVNPPPRNPTKPSNNVVGVICRSTPSLIQIVSFIAVFSY